MNHRPDPRLSDYLSALAPEAVPREDCPDPEHLWDAVLGVSRPARVRELLDHTLDCPVCAETWRLARHLADDEAFPGADSTQPDPARRRGAWAAAGLAAGLVLLAALVTSGWLERDAGPVQRSTQHTGIPRGIESRIRMDRPLPREAFELMWTPGPSGAVYTLEILSEDLDVLYRVRDLEEPRHRVPPQSLEGVASGTMVLWRVEATTPEGAVFVSPTFRATIE